MIAVFAVCNRLYGSLQAFQQNISFPFISTTMLMVLALVDLTALLPLLH